MMEVIVEQPRLHRVCFIQWSPVNSAHLYNWQKKAESLHLANQISILNNTRPPHILRDQYKCHCYCPLSSTEYSKDVLVLFCYIYKKKIQFQIQSLYQKFETTFQYSGFQASIFVLVPKLLGV